MVKPLNHFQKHKQNPYFFIVISIPYQMMSILEIYIIICRRGVPTAEAYYKPYSLQLSRVFVGGGWASKIPSVFFLWHVKQ